MAITKRPISSYATRDKNPAPWPVLKPGEVAKFIRFKNYVGFHWFTVYPGRPLASGADTIERVATMLWETMPPNRKRFWLEKAEHAAASPTMRETRRAMRAYIARRRAEDGYESDGDGFDWDDVHSRGETAIYEAIALADTARVPARQSIIVHEPVPDKPRRATLNELVCEQLCDDFGDEAVHIWDALPEDERECWLQRTLQYLDFMNDGTDIEDAPKTLAWRWMFEIASAPEEPSDPSDLLGQVIQVAKAARRQF